MLRRLFIDFRHSFVNIFPDFEQFDPGSQRYSSVIKISMIIFVPEDLLWIFLMSKILTA
jgi:hypothetical protein